MQALHLDEHLSDPRFSSYVLRKQNEAPLLAVVEPAVEKFTAKELEALLMQVGVPCSRMHNIKEVFEDPHIIDRKVAVDVEHPVMGKMKAVRNPVLFDEDSPTIRRYAPLLGEHSQEILEGLGYTTAQVLEFAQQGIVLLHKDH
jgi:crotonobetainyl-CoA:carnitine CoA-transferase CaiB-like acyl-CoA transferase